MSTVISAAESECQPVDRSTEELDALLQEALAVLESAGQRVTALSACLLGGSPSAIAEATSQLEDGIERAELCLRHCSIGLHRLGHASLGDAAHAFRSQGHGRQAREIEHLLKKISWVVSLCTAGAKRAKQLDRDLTRTIRGLCRSDIAAGQRLIASA